jgi:cytochrome d ubiquinol oxidase subunit I
MLNYPFWDIPWIGSGWVIGAIAIFHVMISHFAVGGGFYLPLAERKALREGRGPWCETLRGHARFFLVLTSVFGAVSGVGIWFSIGLANPEATSTLIHNFVFGWAIEWVFFMVELTTAAVYYYTWGRIDSRLHIKVGWVYAAASFCTLAIINGILTFMLTPGGPWLAVAGTGAEATRFWQAFFNPTYWPSLFLRLVVCTSLAGIWALVTTSRIDGQQQPELKTAMVRWSARWLMPSFLLMPVLMGWYLWMVPQSQRLLLTAGMSTVGPGTFSQLTRMALAMVMTSATIVGVVYFLAYRGPRDFTLTHALGVLALALAATASGEYSREMLRKPYVVGQYMYCNGTRVSRVAQANQEGYLSRTLWIPAAGDTARARGEAMYRGQCAACHTRDGYRSLQRLLAGRNRESVGSLLNILHEFKPDSPYRNFMPPLAGTPQEIAELGDYLYSMIAPAQPVAAANARAPLR